MKPGLRLQIVLLLGGLLLLAFVPLFFAVATYTSVTLQRTRRASARALGRAVAGHVAEARKRRSAADLMSLLDAEIGASGVEAIGVYDTTGEAIARVGHPVAVDSLGATVEPGRERVADATSVHGAAIRVVVPGEGGSVAAVLRTDDESAQAAPLVRLVGLYTALVGLALLVFAYYALTRLIVRPLDSLSSAAQRVATGARRLEVPESGAREISELGASLRTMTERLLRDEEALRRKVEEVETATRELEEAQDRLVRSERLASVGRLAAGLAHEVGNPISALLGMQDLVLEGGLNETEQRDFVERMRKETDRINKIIRDLLQFARPAAAGDEDPTPGNVEAAVNDTAALVSPQTSMKEVALEVDVYPDIPEVRLSREHMVQVFLNLVMNAGDACGPGGRVVIRAEPTEGGARVEVVDDGPGVSEVIRERLFEPFATTKEIGKGTGLGLAVCRGLVEAAGGTISLDDRYRDGARFVIDLPAAGA